MCNLQKNSKEVSTQMMYVDPAIIEEAKQRVPLLPYIEGTTGISAKRIGESHFINPCPLCGGKDHFSINAKENYFKSFSCDAKGTIINFMEVYERLSRIEAIHKLVELAGLSNQLVQEPNQNTNFTKEGNCPMEQEANFTQLIETMHQNVNDTNYFEDRGLSSELINKYKLGFSPDGLNEAIRHSNLLNEKPSDNMKSYKYFLPIWDYDEKCSYFITRVDNSSALENQKVSKTHNLKGYPVKLFNERYLISCESKVIFIVEGIFDALSIEELGHKAIALNSVSNAGKLAKLINEHKETVKEKTFVLIPDNDSAGESLASSMKEKSKEYGFELRISHIPPHSKDANDFLVKDRNSLQKFLDTAITQIDEEWSKQFLQSYLDEFLHDVINNRVVPIPTGFEKLDQCLNGGLVPGLYVVGGGSSIGKTAFVHQITDHISQNGTHVFYYSLEMSKKELVSRSLSRQTFLNSPKEAFSSTEILQGKIPTATLSKVLEKYQPSSFHLSIIEGTFNLDVLNIREEVAQYKQKCEQFVVIVDYLQILQSPKGKNVSDKQLVDYNVTQLKKISRDFDIPVVVLSSFNRSNYNLSVGFESFKESGGIEYSADVVMGLQLRDVEKPAKNEEMKRELMNLAKAKEVRELDLVLLKQRNGIAYSKIGFSHQAKYNYFVCPK
jgi:replicative DNA helicase